MKYANSFKPSWADGDYTPWTIVHMVNEKVSPDVIEGLWETYLAENPELRENDDLLDLFYTYLGELGYEVFQHNWPPILLEMPE